MALSYWVQFSGPSRLVATVEIDFGNDDVILALIGMAALAQQLAYCLRHLGAVEVCGKTGNALNYRRLI